MSIVKNKGSKKTTKKKVKAFICSNDAHYHMGEDYDGVTMYFSEKSLRDHRKCVSSEDKWGCRVVEIEVLIPKDPNIITHDEWVKLNEKKKKKVSKKKVSQK
jgi:hypothetical protein